MIPLHKLEELHGKPVWCHIPSDHPKWGIVDAGNACVVLSLEHLLFFSYYGEWKAYEDEQPLKGWEPDAPTD